ncbi:hypothetical protein FNV43_RR01771 [Rhamnella rubrinervis]|uniref:N-acetyltransferase domain-containing protein n=1 Tax=Rhamnella rubrinervis TaxID=2594499 RepID=A0A8K0MT69_9ROSA|nr:hypothetical protein FNV43_RR01771 [Rhamnella rubrinervis]
MEGNSCSSDGREGESVEFSGISLRPFDLSDVDDFMEWAAHDKVTQYSSWGPLTSKEEGLHFIQKSVTQPWLKSICLDDKSIGLISVTVQPGCNRCRAEIGYVLGSKYWGKGITTYVVKLVVNAIFWEWPHLERLEAHVDVENFASQRVLEKAGFQRECALKKFCILGGKTRDMVLFSFLSNDEFHTS